MVQQGQGGTSRLRLAPEARPDAHSLRGASRAALEHLGNLVQLQRAAVLLFQEDGLPPRVLANIPEGRADHDDPLGGDHKRKGHSGAIVSLPLRAHGKELGLLSFKLREPDGFTAALRQACNSLVANLAESIARCLDAEQRDRLEAEIDRRAEERFEEHVCKHTAALRQQVDRLEQDNARLLEHNAELEAFAHSLAHDLLSPVRTIRSATDALVGAVEDATGSTPPDMVREQAERVRETTGRLGRMVDDLHTYTRLGRMKERLVPIDLHEVVDEALAQLESEIEQSGARVTTVGGLPEVLGHHATLVQALMNLVSNALKFVPPDRRPRVIVRGERRNGRGRLLVQDNGIGIADHQANRIFRIFERLHGAEVYPGSGLGLAIVQRGMTKMGGTVGVRSSPDSGSTFWLELPLAD